MKNVAELSGKDLDYWVARALGNSVETARAMTDRPAWSSDWRVGGPLIDRYGICVQQVPGRPAHAQIINDVGLDDQETGHLEILRPVAGQDGPTPLVAAMRCLVQHRFGRQVAAE